MIKSSWRFHSLEFGYTCLMQWSRNASREVIFPINKKSLFWYEHYPVNLLYTMHPTQLSKTLWNIMHPNTSTLLLNHNVLITHPQKSTECHRTRPHCLSNLSHFLSFPLSDTNVGSHILFALAFSSYCQRSISFYPVVLLVRSLLAMLLSLNNWEDMNWDFWLRLLQYWWYGEIRIMTLYSSLLLCLI